MAVEAKTTEPPAISVIIIHTLAAHQPGPATLTSGLSSELRGALCVWVCVTAQIRPILSRKSLQ